MNPTIQERADTLGQLVTDAKSRRKATRALASKAWITARTTRANSRAAVGAHALLVAFAESRRKIVADKIESTVSAALRAVFGPDMNFRFDVDIKRGVVCLTPEVGRTLNGQVEWEGLDQVGGGVVDVVAFALRVCLLVMRRPRLRPTLFADEPFKSVSDSFLPQVAEMCKGLSHAAGVQLVIVSHEQPLADAADQLFVVSRNKKGESVVTMKTGTTVNDPEEEGEDDDGPLVSGHPGFKKKPPYPNRWPKANTP